MKPLLLLGLAQALFALGWFILKKPRHLTDGVVALFLFTLALPLGLKLANFSVQLDGPLWVALDTAVPFLYGPLLFLYTLLSVAETPRLRPRWLLHGVPFAVILALSLMFPQTVPNDLARVRPPERPAVTSVQTPDTPWVARRGGGGDGSTAPRMTWVFLFGALAASCLLYAAFIFRALARHRKTLPDFFSSPAEHMGLSWLQWTAAAFLFTGLFTALFRLLLPTVWILYSLPPGLAQIYGTLFFLFVFSMFTVKQNPVYPESPSGEPRPTAAPAIETSGPRYERSGLKEGDARSLAARLSEWMDREKPWQDSELTIIDVAEALGVPRHHVSQVLAERFQENFYTFVNRRRVTCALDLMERDPDLPLVRVAAESGFNSKSTFHRVFRAMTGRPPSEHRAQHQV